MAGSDFFSNVPFEDKVLFLFVGFRLLVFVYFMLIHLVDQSIMHVNYEQNEIDIVTI